MRDYIDIYDIELTCPKQNVTAKVLDIKKYNDSFFRLKISATNFDIWKTEIQEVAPDLVSSPTDEISGTYDATFYAFIPTGYLHKPNVEKEPFHLGYDDCQVEVIDYTVHDEIQVNCNGWDKSTLEKMIENSFNEVIRLTCIYITIREK